MTIACDDRHHDAPDNFHRDVFASRVRAQLTRETHVIVGDHTPEVRPVRHEWGDPCDKPEPRVAMNRYCGQAFKDGPR